MTDIDPRDRPVRRTDDPDVWPDDPVTRHDDRLERRDDQIERSEIDRRSDRDDRSVRGATVVHQDDGADDVPMRKVRETKPAFLTTEFWLTLGGIAALVVIYLVEDDDSLDLFRTCLLATMLGVAYVVSRGLAKAGSRTTRMPDDARFLGRTEIR